MKNFIFRNAMKFENRKAQKKILLRLLGAALLLLFVLKTALDGFSVVTLWLVLVGIGFLAQKGSPVIVENVLTEIQFDRDSIRIIYRDLDRHDGKGKRKEIYDMGSRDIVSIRYSDRHQMLEICSRPVLRICGEAGETAKDFRQTGEMDRQILYLADEQTREPILQNIHAFCSGRMQRG